jgi:hypothetical protein
MLVILPRLSFVFYATYKRRTTFCRVILNKEQKSLRRERDWLLSENIIIACYHVVTSTIVEKIYIERSTGFFWLAFKTGMFTFLTSLNLLSMEQVGPAYAS